MLVKEMGTVGYGEAFALQENLTDLVQENIDRETLLLLEHPLVYTIGRSGSDANVLDHSVDVIRINRGGDITCHGPGQLVGYPIINLGRRGKDLRHYLRFLEEVIIRVAVDLGVTSYRMPGRTGVWTDRGKLASIGVAVRRWISMHGFALNVNTDLSIFERIHPCGIKGCPMSSISDLCGTYVPMEEVKALVATHFESLLETWLPLSTDFKE